MRWLGKNVWREQRDVMTTCRSLTAHATCWQRFVSTCSDRSRIAALHMSAFDAVDGSFTGTGVPSTWSLLRLPRFGGASMQAVTTIGFDIAKSVFQVHGVDSVGQ